MVRRAAAGLLAACWLLSQAFAAPPLADRLPGESIVYVGWAGRNLAFDGSMLGQLLAEAPVTNAIAAWGQALAAGAKPAIRQQALEHELNMVAIGWQHRTALCVLPPGDSAPAAGGRAELPAMILLVDLGKDQPAFAEHLEALLRLGGEALSISEATTAGITYRTFRLPMTSLPLAYGYTGDMFFLTTGADTPARLIAVLAAGAPNLAAAPDFTAAYAEVTGESEQWGFYAEMPDALALLRPPPAGTVGTAPAGSPTDKLAEALGLSKVTHVAGSTRVVDRGMYTRLRIATLPPHRGLPLLLSQASLTPATDLAAAPADAQALLACRAAGSALWLGIRQVLEASGERRLQRLDQALTTLDERLGLSLQDDVLAGLAEPWMLVSAPSLGGLATGTAFITALKSPEQLREQLAGMQAALISPASRPAPRPGDLPAGRPTPSLQVLPVDQAQIAYLQLPGKWAVAPAWALQENQLIVAAWPQVVQGVIQRDRTHSLAAQPAFQGGLHYITGKPAALLYLDTPRILSLVYGQALADWTRAANRQSREGTSVQPGWLPSLSMLNRFVGPSMVAVSVDDRGILVEDYGWIAAIPTTAAYFAVRPYLPESPPQAQAKPLAWDQALDYLLAELSRLPRAVRPAPLPATTTAPILP